MLQNNQKPLSMIMSKLVNSLHEIKTNENENIFKNVVGVTYAPPNIFSNSYSVSPNTPPDAAPKL